MPNKPVPAAASGLPQVTIPARNPDRRGFLRGILAAPFAAAVPLVPALAGRRQPVAEDPRLLALEVEVTSAITALVAAAERKRRARELAETLAPSVPRELVVDADVKRRFHVRGEEETDIEGERVWPEGNAPPRRILTVRELAASVQDYHPQSGIGRWQRRRLRIAQGYERARERACEEAGLGAANEAHFWAKVELQKICKRAVELAPATWTGLIIQARAVAAYAGAGTEERYLASILHEPKLVENIVRLGVVGEAPARAERTLAPPSPSAARVLRAARGGDRSWTA